MNQTKIKLITLGYMPHSINFQNIKKWKSEVFIVTSYEQRELLPDSEGAAWRYTDDQLQRELPIPPQGELILAIVNLPLTDNYYARRIQNNRIVVSTYEMADILAAHNIPLENYIYRMLYKYTAMFKRDGRIPTVKEPALSHQETRACIFDKNPNKSDIIYSTEKLALCAECKVDLMRHKVSTTFLNGFELELKQVKKNTYHRILDFVKRRPILTIIISLLSGLFVNLISSFLYELITAS